MMFGLFPTPYVIGAGIVAALAGVWLVYQTGYNHASERCKSQQAAIELRLKDAYSAELERMQTAMQKAQDQQIKLSEELNAKESQLEKILNENSDEAHNDNTADTCGVGHGGVRRLNKVR